MHGAPARRGSAGARHGDSASCSAAVDARNGKSQLTRAPAIASVGGPAGQSGAPKEDPGATEAAEAAAEAAAEVEELLLGCI